MSNATSPDTLEVFAFGINSTLAYCYDLRSIYDTTNYVREE